MSKNSIRIWLLISVLLAIGVAPFLAQGDQATIKLREENAQEIGMMSQSERDRLETQLLGLPIDASNEDCRAESFPSKTGRGPKSEFW